MAGNVGQYLYPKLYLLLIYSHAVRSRPTVVFDDCKSMNQLYIHDHNLWEKTSYGFCMIIWVLLGGSYNLQPINRGFKTLAKRRIISANRSHNHNAYM